MASYEADGIERIDSHEQGRWKDLVTGKPINAEILRVYGLADESSMDDVIADAIDAAETAGWTFDASSPTDTGFGGVGTLGYKDFDWGLVGMTLVVGPTPGEPDSPVRLRITIAE